MLNFICLPAGIWPASRWATSQRISTHPVDVKCLLDADWSGQGEVSRSLSFCQNDVFMSHPLGDDAAGVATVNMENIIT